MPTARVALVGAAPVDKFADLSVGDDMGHLPEFRCRITRFASRVLDRVVEHMYDLGMEGIRRASSWVSAAVATEPVPHLSDDAPSDSDVVVAQADAFVAWLATTSGAGVKDAVRIDRITALERVKGAVAAAQARQTVAFAESQRASMPAWTSERTAARSIGSQIALARHESPTQGDAHVALAQALAQAMPRTLAALTAGRISEGAAEGVHRAVEGVDPGRRREVDSRLAPELGQLGERSLAEAARRVVADVDEEAATRRADRATRGRRVTLRTAPDGMAYLTVLAPMAEATGAFQAVEAEATAILGQPAWSGGPSRRSAFWLEDPADQAQQGRESLFLSGDVRRTRCQMMTDVVISRLTGRAIGQPVPIEIQLVMTDAALHQDTATERDAHGPEQRVDTPPSCRGREAGHHEPPADRAAQTPRHRQAEHARCELGAESSGHPAFPRTPPSTGGPAKAETEPDSGACSGSDGPGTPGVPLRASPGAAPSSNSPAKIVGAGWLPAGFARELIRRTAAARSDVTVRRVLSGADGATVTGLEARRHPLGTPETRAEPIPLLAPSGSMQRLFRGVLRRLVVVRDQSCRTPFCAAAIRAVDHVTPARRDGPTCVHNAEGKCQRCNLTKEAPGWKVVVLSSPPVMLPDLSDPPWKQLMDELLAADPDQTGPDWSHRTAVVTPTGHRYVSTAPPVTEPRLTRLATTDARRAAHGPSG